MNISVSLPDAVEIDDGVWKVQLNPAEASVFGKPDYRNGAVSILVLSESPIYEKSSGTLSFKLNTTKFLYSGNSLSALVIYGASKDQKGVSSGYEEPSSGDDHFISSLPPKLKELGLSLLTEIRNENPNGQLVFHPNSGKYVESPNNYWTVRIQPRDESLRVTVYGLPHSFDTDSSVILLKKDMSSYSAFKVSVKQQLQEALSVIRQARMKKEIKTPN